MKALINADELANDVAGAEALLDRHQEHKVPHPLACIWTHAHTHTYTHMHINMDTHTHINMNTIRIAAQCKHPHTSTVWCRVHLSTKWTLC